MKKLNSFLLITLLLSSCVPATETVPTLTSTKTVTLTPTITPTRTSTPTPTPKIYTLRIEFSTTADWSNLQILDASSIMDVRLVDKQGNPTDFYANKTIIGVSQTLADAEAFKEASITVDLDISGSATDRSIPFLLQKGDLNDTDIRFYNVLNGTKYSLLDEVYRAGWVEPKTALNPYNFSFDLKPLLQDVAAIAALTQSEAMKGKFIFEYYKAAYEKAFPDLKGELNIFTSNWDGTNLTPITDGLNGFNRINSISPDGKVVLVSSRSGLLGKDALYLIDLNSTNNAPIKLAKELDGKAIFLDNARIVYIGKGSKGYGIYTVNIDGTDQSKIGVPTVKAWRGIESSDKTRVYWIGTRKEYFRDSSGALYAYGDFGGLWWTNIDGSGQGKLESNGRQIFPTQLGEGVAFSPDGTRIAWISVELEQGCSGALGAFWTPWIRNGTYTAVVGKPSQFLGRNSPYFEKVIDIPFVEDYVRRCNIMHVAPLSEMDNDAKIPLIPPFDPAKDDFYYHADYVLKWWPDSSKILAYDPGQVRYVGNSVAGRSPISIFEIAPEDANPKLVLLKVLSYSSVVQPGSGAMPHLADSYTAFRFSPDGRQLLFAKYNPYANFYSAYINILNLETMNFVDSFGSHITPDAQVKSVGSIYWLP